MDTNLDGSTAIILAVIVLIILAFGAVWTANGPEIAARLEIAFAPAESAAYDAALDPQLTEIELLPDGVLVSPDIDAGAASLLSIVNQKYGTVIDYSTSHAVTKHKAEAINVRHCLENGGQAATLFDDRTGYKLRLCQVDDLTVGIQVVVRGAAGRWKEITAYYLQNSSTVREAVLDFIDAGKVVDWALKEVMNP